MGKRSGITFDKKRLEQRFGATCAADFDRPRYHIAPSHSVPAILNTAPTVIQLLTWGLRPAWLPRVTRKERIINVRAETLRERRTFQPYVAERRCFVLADSFYTWKKAGPHTIPYRVVLRSGEPFALAGIWEEHTDTDGHPVKTFALITTASNPLVSQVHPRMPVILRKETERQWVDNALPPQQLLSLLSPYPAQWMRMYEVAPRVNRTADDAPALIHPIH